MMKSGDLISGDRTWDFATVNWHIYHCSTDQFIHTMYPWRIDLTTKFPPQNPGFDSRRQNLQISSYSRRTRLHIEYVFGGFKIPLRDCKLRK